MQVNSYESGIEYLNGGRRATSRPYANNTRIMLRKANVFEDAFSVVVMLHSTDVVTFKPDGRIVLDSGGWRTYTTKDRINAALPREWGVSQDRGVWYVSHRNGAEHRRVCIFADGMTLYPDGTTDGGKPLTAEVAAGKLRKKIGAYAKAYVDALFAGEIDPPGLGDCLFCGMHVVEPAKDAGKALGEAFRDDSHILMHIEEAYFVPSLVENAVKRFPLSRFGRDVLTACWIAKDSSHVQHATALELRDAQSVVGYIGREQIRKSIRRYLQEQTGQAS